MTMHSVSEVIKKCSYSEEEEEEEEAFHVAHLCLTGLHDELCRTNALNNLNKNMRLNSQEGVKISNKKKTHTRLHY